MEQDVSEPAEDRNRDAVAEGGPQDDAVDAWLEELMGLDPEARAAALSSETILHDGEFEQILAELESGDADQAQANLSRLLRFAFSDAPPDQALRDRLREIQELGPSSRRFVQGRLVGRGGMGEIRAVHDRSLRRELAIKFLRPDRFRSDRPSATVARRFVDEAQVTAQLEHPGIVPVHDIGVDETGRPFFAMQLVHGVSFGEALLALHRAPTAKGGRVAGGVTWTRERAVETLLRAAEAVAFAHSRHVIHRDLKPDNIMVGEFGAVYVMDWGLARLLDDEYPITDTPGSLDDGSSIVTDGHDRSFSSSGGLSTTRDGDLLGTVHYMSPEQASGRHREVGPKSDGYALGSILYHLLSGRRPYDDRADDGLPQILQRVAASTPQPIEEAAPDAPAELRAICRRAMSLRPEDRYEDVAAFADDLRAYLEVRVVRAHNTGPVVRAAKWIERNRALSRSLAAAAAVVLVTLVGWRMSVVDAQEKQRAREADRRLLANFTAFVQLDELEQAALEPDSIHPDRIGVYEDWLARADALLSAAREEIGIDFLAASYEEQVEPTAFAIGDGALNRAQLLEHERRMARTADVVATRGGDPTEADTLLDWADDAGRQAASLETTSLPLPATLTASLGRSPERPTIIERLEALAGVAPGPRRGTTPAFAIGIETRLELARLMVERQADPEVAAAWATAHAVAGDPDGVYGGLRLGRDPRLAPLGVDAESGLLEFAHLATGAVPERDGNGRLALDGESAVVLVLVPGGEYGMGAEDRRTAWRFDPLSRLDEGPCHDVELSPFLLAKHELTQAQWQRLTGTNPSAYDFASSAARDDPPPIRIGPTNPVENVTWLAAVQTLASVGMELPTEAQFEAAASGGTSRRWSTGDDRSSLNEAANLIDREAAAFPEAPKYWADFLAKNPAHTDPFVLHAPVGSFDANAFGLHDTTGNVREWTADSFGPYPNRDGTGVPVWHGRGERSFVGLPALDADANHVARGGAFTSSHVEARITFRERHPAGSSHANLGLRAAMRPPLAAAE